MEDCAALNGAALQIRPNPILSDVWAQAALGSGWQSVTRRAHVLDLVGGFDETWNNRVSAKTRSQVRKAQRIGVTVDTGSSLDLVADFFDLFRLSISRWARKQNEFEWLAALRGHFRDPRRKFYEMARLFGDGFRVFIARLDGRAIAGIVVLFGNNAHYTRGAMDEVSVGNTGANLLLHRIAIAEACDRSCRHYHMGETGSSTSLATFKERFGAVAIPYAEYRFERIPLMTADRKLRSFVKDMIGFQDA